jgi:Type IV pili methyl-accepting chemotaxis transducer N-term
MTHPPINMRRRLLIAAVGASATLPLTLVIGQASAQAQIVDRAGSLRMLSQRIAKAYCQLGQSVLSNDAETILAKSVSRFNGALVTVRANAAAPQNVIKLIESDWAQLRDLATVTPSKDAFKKVDALADALTENADALAAQLATALGVQSARWTNVSGRQRMLSQRMAKSAFALMWGLDSKAYAQQYDTARTQFNVALTELQRVQHNAPLITRNLEMAEIQVGLFDTALGARTDIAKLTAPRAVNVARTNERLLELFDEITNQFSAVKA